MSSDDTWWSPGSVERPRVVLALLLSVLIAAGFFIPTVTAYVSYEGIERTDVRVTNLSVEDGRLQADLVIHNPTRTPFTVIATELFARAGRQPVISSVSGNSDRTTIPPGETRTVRARVLLESNLVNVTNEAISAGTLGGSGKVYVMIRNQQATIHFEWGDR